MASTQPLSGSTNQALNKAVRKMFEILVETMTVVNSISLTFTSEDESLTGKGAKYNLYPPRYEVIAWREPARVTFHPLAQGRSYLGTRVSLDTHR